MRLIVTGNSKNGLSKVIQDGPPGAFLVFEATEDLMSAAPREIFVEPAQPGEKESSSAALWQTGEVAPVVHVSAKAGEPADFIHLQPGATRWVMLRYGPFAYASPHWSTTLDYDYIVSGAGELILDECVVEVRTGDCIVLPAVKHAWRAGPEGLVMNVVMTGIASMDVVR